MRTTLDIDDDVLAMAKDFAASKRTSTGKALSEMARRGARPVQEFTLRNGVPVIHTLPPGAPKHTLADVNRLRDDD